MEKIKLAVCQMDVVEDKASNLKKAEAMIRQVASKVDVVVLPEMFNCPYSVKRFPSYAETDTGETNRLMATLARDLKVHIIAGTIPEKDGEDLYNTSYVFDDAGKMIAKHRKVHLFDVAIENGITFQESAILKAGEDLTLFDVKGVTLALAICYDMRFPEMIREMTLKGAEVVVIPAAFNTITGPAHWHMTCRCRAVDNQVYFIAASPARSLDLSYKAYGHSMVVSPWGEILAEAGQEEGIIYAEIDRQVVRKIRNELPLLKHNKYLR